MAAVGGFLSNLLHCGGVLIHELLRTPLMLNIGQGSIGPGVTGRGNIFTLSATLLSVAAVPQNHFRNGPGSFLNVVRLFFFFACVLLVLEIFLRSILL